MFIKDRYLNNIVKLKKIMICGNKIFMLMSTFTWNSPIGQLYNLNYFALGFISQIIMKLGSSHFTWRFPTTW
jgi:hypothetical protein